MVGGRASQKGTLLTNVPDVSGAEDAFKKILRLKIKQNSKLEITASLTTSILRRRNGTEKREAGARAGQAGSQLRPHVMWVSSCRPLTALQIDRAIGLNHTLTVQPRAPAACTKNSCLSSTFVPTAQFILPQCTKIYLFNANI